MMSSLLRRSDDASPPLLACGSLAARARLLRGVRRAQAPELFKTGGVHNEKVDVYSFGVILYELLTGREPWSHIKVGGLGRVDALTPCAGQGNLSCTCAHTALVKHPRGLDTLKGAT